MAFHKPSEQRAEPTDAVAQTRSSEVTPDLNSQGLLDQPVDSLRYDDHDLEDPSEVAGMIRKLMPRNARVLDIGCGTGSLTLEVTRGLDCEVLGIEPDPARAALAQSRGLRAICGLADAAFFAEHGPFDIIIFSDVLEHLPDPATLLRDAGDALAVDGRIIASVPNVAHWTVRTRLLFGKFEYADSGIMDATHLRWFTIRSIKALFARCGLDVTQMQWTAGTWMAEYGRMPMGLMPKGFRLGVIRQLSRRMPAAFGAQHIVEAKRAV